MDNIIEELNKFIVELDEHGDDVSLISDGYHTYKQLYEHRAVMFAIICNTNQECAWKSKQHSDGTMYDGYFLVGVSTPEGDYSYHYKLDKWDMFKVDELRYAPLYDGHMPDDINRLFSLYE